VDLSYDPPKRVLLSDLKPAAVSLRVVDQRPMEQQNSVGVRRNMILGTEHSDIISSTHVIEVIYDALKTEFERAGHTVLNSEQGQGEITLIVWLKQLVLDSKVAGWTSNWSGAFGRRLSLFPGLRMPPRSR